MERGTWASLRSLMGIPMVLVNLPMMSVHRRQPRKKEEGEQDRSCR
jgi:hypothetical protein